MATAAFFTIAYRLADSPLGFGRCIPITAKTISTAARAQPINLAILILFEKYILFFCFTLFSSEKDTVGLS